MTNPPIEKRDYSSESYLMEPRFNYRKRIWEWEVFCDGAYRVKTGSLGDYAKDAYHLFETSLHERMEEWSKLEQRR